MRSLILFLLFHIYVGHTQENLPKDYFINPLNIPLATSGTYGELRSNHFHAGLDLKTEGCEGLDVYATASGRVSRIKISNFGYGKAIYITHPNGYTSVYAHLKKFSPAIEAYIKKRQYAKESYQIQVYPKAGVLPVKKGEIIAYSGNTGGSGGPHLHFEIRDPKGRPMNPMSFGIDIKDSKKPIIHGVWAYSLDSNAHTDGTQQIHKLQLIPQGDGNFKTKSMTAFGKIGFGISAIDHQDLSTNKNGIYSITTELNGQKIFELSMNRFSFSETRYINRLIDYPYYKKNRHRITKLYIEKNNPLPIYNNVFNKGIMTIKDSLSYSLKVSVKDFKNNTTIIEIPIEGKKSKLLPIPKAATTPEYAKSNQNYSFSTGIFDVFIGKGALYEDTYLDIKTAGDTIHVHTDETPMHKNMSIAFDVSKYKEIDRKQLYIGRLGKGKKHYYTTTKKKGNRFSTRTKTFGSYSLFTDREQPIVRPINVSDNQWISNERFLKLKISDTGTGIQSYRGTINGKFIVMEYDYKTGTLMYDFNDHIITDTKNNFKLIVLDKVGNSTTFETIFYRKL